MTKALEAVEAKSILSERPGVDQVNAVIVPGLMAGLERAKTPEEANAYRTAFAMLSKYVQGQAAILNKKRGERAQIMWPAERGYVEASARAGASMVYPGAR